MIGTGLLIPNAAAPGAAASTAIAPTTDALLASSGALPVELQMLAWAIALGIAHLLLAAALMTRQRGLKWNTGARDGVAAPLDGVAARVDRAFRNFLETFAFFAAAVLAVAATGRGNADTALGAQMYLWARVAYVPVYAAGIPYLRTLVWGVSLWGLWKVLKGLLF